VRGLRRDERPPDVGPNAPWWPKYRPYADACRRLSWLNTDSRHVCRIAILAEATHLPYRAARVCFQNQRDFNYLELRHLWEDARVDSDGVHLVGMDYRAVILDGLGHLPEKAVPALEALAAAGRLLVWDGGPTTIEKVRRANTPEELVAAIDRLIPPDLSLDPASLDVRYRHVIKRGGHFYILLNEGPQSVTVKVAIAASGRTRWLNCDTGEASAAAPHQPVAFRPHEMKILTVLE
jgi:hypothetical protein